VNRSIKVKFYTSSKLPDEGLARFNCFAPLQAWLHLKGTFYSKSSFTELNAMLGTILKKTISSVTMPVQSTGTEPIKVLFLATPFPSCSFVHFCQYDSMVTKGCEPQTTGKWVPCLRLHQILSSTLEPNVILMTSSTYQIACCGRIFERFVVTSASKGDKGDL